MVSLLLSNIFQNDGYNCYGTSQHHPARLSEFSRWIEYFCTSPVLNLLVMLSIGFVSRDGLLGCSRGASTGRPCNICSQTPTSRHNL
jgi:hypothetical protein